MKKKNITWFSGRTQTEVFPKVSFPAWVTHSDSRVFSFLLIALSSISKIYYEKFDMPLKNLSVFDSNSHSIILLYVFMLSAFVYLKTNTRYN